MKACGLEAGLAELLREFFLERHASAQTVAAYRDSFRLLPGFAQQHPRKSPERLVLTELDVPLIPAFRNHLEAKRHNTIRSRNARFAANRSFLHFAALKEPAVLPLIKRFPAIPAKRYNRPLLRFLSRSQVQAALGGHHAAVARGPARIRHLPGAGQAPDFRAHDSPLERYPHAAGGGRGHHPHCAMARHESATTTHMYVEADLATKERPLKAMQAPQIKPARYRPTARQPAPPPAQWVPPSPPPHPNRIPLLPPTGSPRPPAPAPVEPASDSAPASPGSNAVGGRTLPRLARRPHTL